MEKLSAEVFLFRFDRDRAPAQKPRSAADGLQNGPHVRVESEAQLHLIAHFQLAQLPGGDAVGGDHRAGGREGHALAGDDVRDLCGELAIGDERAGEVVQHDLRAGAGRRGFGSEAWSEERGLGRVGGTVHRGDGAGPMIRAGQPGGAVEPLDPELALGRDIEGGTREGGEGDQFAILHVEAEGEGDVVPAGGGEIVSVHARDGAVPIAAATGEHTGHAVLAHHLTAPEQGLEFQVRIGGIGGENVNGPGAFRAVGVEVRGSGADGLGLGRIGREGQEEKDEEKVES